MTEIKDTHYKDTLHKLKSMMVRSEVKYTDDINLADKIISIYSIMNKEKNSRILPFEKSVLVYYVLFGFSKESKETVKKALKKNENQLNTTNSNLRSKGYLHKDNRNKTNGYVSKDLVEMVHTFLNDKSKVLVTVFTKNKEVKK